MDVLANTRMTETTLHVGEFTAVFFDLSLPDGDGIALLTSLRQQGRRRQIVIMTARDQISDRICGLDHVVNGD